MYSGFLNVLKPPGMTSHDLVAWLRRTLRQKRIGHSGTLDPNAAGVMVIALGAATRLLEYLDDQAKEYIGLVRLGIDTDTYDSEGQIVRQYPEMACTLAEVQTAAAGFLGQQRQKPPLVSAIRIGGKRLYEYARRGLEVDRPERVVVIHELEISPLQVKPVYGIGDLLRLRVRCSKGTYIRSLAYDLGRRLGGGAHLASLLRTESDGFGIDGALTIEEVTQLAAENRLSSVITSMERPLRFRKVDLTESELKPILNGNALSVSWNAKPGEFFCLMHHGRLTAIAEYGLKSGRGYLQPVKVLAHEQG
ncbi:MAG: tRNA pseudouridine(55) synthase TruB [Firmicutes bacterium]|nr:tRNA pseudouridine(55) synthase TruB [Bacillota bacterium]